MPPIASHAGVINEIIQHLTAMHAGKAVSEIELNWGLLLVLIVVGFIIIVIAARIKGARDYGKFLKKEEKEKK